MDEKPEVKGAPAIKVRGKDHEETVRRALMIWCRRFPQEVGDYVAQMRAKKSRTIQGGWSQNKTMVLIGEIPQRIHDVLSHPMAWGSDWIYEQDKQMALWKAFAKFRINGHTLPRWTNPDRELPSPERHKESFGVRQDMFEQLHDVLKEEGKL